MVDDTRLVLLPDGREVAVKSSVTDEQLFKHLGIKGNTPVSSPGIGSAIGGAFARGVGGAARGIGSALEDTRFADTGRSMRASGDEILRNAPKRVTPGFSDSKGFKQTAGSLIESTLESVPQIAAGVGAGAVTTAATAPFLGPGSVVAGAAAGRAVMGGVTGAQTYGEIRDEQRKKGIDDKGRAALTATAAGALDAFTGVDGRVIKGAFGRVATEEAERAARKGFLRETGRTAAEEAGTEITQQGLQRYGGYQDLMSDEALKEYVDSGAAGAFGGAVFNTAARGIENRRQAKADRNRAIDDSVDAGESVNLNQWGKFDENGQRELFDSLPPERAGPTRTAEQANPTPADPREQLNDLVRARRQLTSGVAAAEEAGNREQFYKLQDQLNLFDEKYGELANNLDAAVNRQRAALGDVQGELAVDTPRGTPPTAPGKNLSQMIFEQSPEGSQGDLFSPIPTAPGQESAPAQPDAQPPVTGEAVQDAANEPTLFQRFPTATVRTNPRYSLGAVAQAIRGKTAADSYTLRLAKRLSGVLGTGLTSDNAQQAASNARDIIERETEKLVEADARGQLQSKNIDARLKVFENARAIIDAYQTEMATAQADEQLQNPDNKGVQIGAPIPDATEAIGQINEKNRDTAVAEANKSTTAKVEAAKVEAAKAAAAKTAPASDEDFAQATQTVVDGQRKAIIDGITSKSDVTDPFGAIRAAFKKVGLDPSLREEEQSTIEKSVTARTAKQSAAEAFPEPESGVAELEAQIRGEKKPATRPAGPKPTGNNAQPASKSPENFKLETQTEADISAREAAQARRERKAAPPEPIDSTDPKAQGELFTDKGNPTKAARQKAAPKPKTTVSEELKAKKAAKPTVSEKLKAERKVEKPDDEPPPPTKAPVPAKKTTDKPKRPTLTPKAKASGNTSLGDQLRAIAADTTAEDAEMSPELRAEYDEVLKEAESYMADDGESGALKPKEYQQLSVLADNETFTPEELRQKLNDLVERRAQARLEERYGAPTSPEAPAKASKPQPRTVEKPGKLLGTISRQRTRGNHDSIKLPTPVGTYTVQELLARAAKGNGSVATAAKALMKVAPNVQVVVMTRADFDRTVDRTDMDGAYDTDKKQILFPESGVDGENLVHELIHAIMWSRINFNPQLKSELKALFDKYNKLSPNSNSYGFEDVHEFVSEVWANPAFRKELRSIGFAQVGTQPTNMLDKIKELARRALAGVLRRNYDPPAVRAVMADIDTIMERTFDVAQGKFSELVVPEDTPADMRPTPRALEKKVSKLPEGMQESAYQIADVVNNAKSKTLSAVAFTKDLIDMVKGPIPAFQKYAELMVNKVVTAQQLNNVTGDVLNAFRKLPVHLQNVGKNTLNSVIQDIDEVGVWVFEPTWLKSKGVEGYSIDNALRKEVEYARIAGDPDQIAAAQKKLDAALAAKAAFERLPKAAQDAVKQVFKHEHDLLVEVKRVVREAMGAAYTDPIEKAREDGNTQEVSRLEKERDTGIADYQRLLSIDERRPYASRRRYGDYVVAMKSQELVDAQNDGENKQVIQKMMADPQHYFVQRYSTMREAGAERRKIQKAAPQFKDENAYHGPVDKAQDMFVGGKDMVAAFGQIKTQIGQMAEENIAASNKSINALNRLVADLYIHALSNTSARKSELKRLGVAGGDMDMMRNFVTQSRATANLIAALKNNQQISETLAMAGRQARKSSDPQAMDIYNEVMARHMGAMDTTPAAWAEKVKATTSLYMLLTKPFYHVQNMLQPAVLTLPVLAGRYSYSDATGQMYQAYKEIAAAWDSITTPLDFDKMTNEANRAVIEELANRGAIDIGAQQDLGSFESLPDDGLRGGAKIVMDKLRGLTRLTEAINRSTSGLAAYNLARNGNKELGVKPRTHDEAIQYAIDVIHDTHGSYDGFNAPRFMRSGVGSTLTQFKKFQMMQVGLLAKQLNTSMNSTDPVEKAVAKRAFTFTMLHTAIVAGSLGMPGAATLIWLWNQAMGDDDEPEDIEQDIRDAIGDKDLADLILKGAPSLIDVDVSDRLGMGQAFSILPYTELDMSRSGGEKAIIGLMGPSTALGLRFLDGLDMMSQGDYWRAGEKLLPGILADGTRAMREAKTGVTNRNGDQLVSPDDVSTWQDITRTLGLNTTDTSERMRQQNSVIKLEDFYKDRTKQLNRRFIEARRDKDTDELAAIRQEFQGLQAARVKNGFKRQPVSNLIRMERAMRRRERDTVDGVQYPENSPMARRARMERLEQLEAAEDTE